MECGRNLQVSPSEPLRYSVGRIQDRFFIYRGRLIRLLCASDIYRCRFSGFWRFFIYRGYFSGPLLYLRVGVNWRRIETSSEVSRGCDLFGAHSTVCLIYQVGVNRQTLLHLQGQPIRRPLRISTGRTYSTVCLFYRSRFSGLFCASDIYRCRFSGTLVLLQVATNGNRIETS